MSAANVMFSAFAHGPAPVDVLSLDYQDRQRLVVVPDAVAQALRTASEQARSGQAAAAAEALAGSVAAGASAGVVATASAMLGVPALAATAVPLPKLLDQLMRWRRRDPPFLTIGRSESTQLRFPPGHPHDNLLYIGNPVEPVEYYQAADFHKRTFEHKTAELRRLLAFLGATRIEIIVESGWRQTSDGSLRAPLVKLPGTVAAKLRRQSQRRASSETLRELGAAEPQIPPGLVWYAHEREWRDTAELRMLQRITSDNVALRYSDNYGIDADLTARIAKLKIGVGGKFERQVDTLWRLHVTYG